jgi:hypothetical protein
MTGDREKWVWTPDMLEVVKGTVELTPDEERRVEERLEADAFDPGEDDYSDWFSGANR